MLSSINNDSKVTATRQLDESSKRVVKKQNKVGVDTPLDDATVGVTLPSVPVHDDTAAHGNAPEFIKHERSNYVSSEVSGRETSCNKTEQQYLEATGRSTIPELEVRTSAELHYSGCHLVGPLCVNGIEYDLIDPVILDRKLDQIGQHFWGFEDIAFVKHYYEQVIRASIMPPMGHMIEQHFTTPKTFPPSPPPTPAKLSPSSVSTESLNNIDQTVEKKDVSPRAPTNPDDGQPVDDILEMSRPHRQYLLEGPHIIIHIGDTAIPNIPKRFAMAASPVLNEYFSTNPTSLDWSAPPGPMDVEAIKNILIAWPQHESRHFQCAPLQPTTFAKDIAIITTAYLLGMNAYTQHVRYHMRNYLQKSLSEYYEILLVMKYRVSSKDPSWTCMVNNLCYQRHQGLIPDTEEFEDFLTRNPLILYAMESADEYFRAREKGRREGVRG
ncbi:hypothetical protein CC80DRAFT_582097 [Byssothecium circinans]|uniref:Uncharacterized protein n=1 Tax=Byssothecium circinans TaxID=147558 RepID=A0A6A5T9N0_9PLEO|nr:hypothetical protein CC80DRAFT_582097 [Byssothecium circinans]